MLGSWIRPMTVISATVLPEPDSPTTPTISRGSMRKETPPTARSSPRSVRKETLRSRTSSKASLGLGKAHPGGEGGIGEVDHGIGRNDEERGVDDGRHDDRKIDVQQRLVGQLADALQAE